jgi:thioredoxin reductase
MLCFSCGKQKNELQPHKSDILVGQVFMMCATCIESKFEPRWVIVLGGRQNGPESIRDYIAKRRYIGRPISAEELLA